MNKEISLVINKPLQEFTGFVMQTRGQKAAVVQAIDFINVKKFYGTLSYSSSRSIWSGSGW